jgi:hypothetical protein
VKGKAMKHTVRIMLFLVVGGFVTGCKATDKDSKAQSDDLGTAAAQREKAMTATKEAAQSIQHYAYAQRVEFIDAAKRELSDIQREMERLRAAADRSTGAARADAEAKLEVLSDKLAAAKTQFDRAATATEASWEDVQNRYQKARGDLKDSFDETRQWLSEKMEP